MGAELGGDLHTVAMLIHPSLQHLRDSRNHLPVFALSSKVKRLANPGPDFNRLFEAFMAYTGFVLSKRSSDELAAINENIIANLCGSDTELGLSSIISERDQNIHAAFLDLSRAYIALDDHHIMLRRNPFRKQMSDEHWLSRVITSYLNDVYLFQERARRFVLLVGRRHKDRSGAESALRTAFGSKNDKTKLGELISIRGAHTHDVPWLDTEVSKLGLMCLFLTPTESEIIPPHLAQLAKYHAPKQSSVIRKKWQLIFEVYNAEVDQALAVICKYASDHLFGGMLAVATSDEPITTNGLS